VENPAALPEPAARLIVDATWGVAILGLFSVSLVSIMLRFRRSRDTERQQLKWLALAGGVVIVAFAVSMWAQAAPAPWPTVVGLIAFCSFASMPVAVAVAILRYRLYELDRIVSKTLVYGALTVILGAGYAGLVLAGQWASSSFAGGSSLAIAVSTLAVAALVLPLRRRLQRVVDRRFYRRRYDAQRTLEAFGTRLREQVELDALAADLRAVVDETMGSAHVSLWLRRGGAAA
jgi:hypothetical protein